MAMLVEKSGKKVVIQGLNDFIVIEKEDVILICPQKDQQNIKEIVADVKENFGNQLT